MELQPANADAAAPREACSRLLMAGKECDALKRSTIVGRDLNTKRGQAFARIRHQTLTAGLFDGRAKSIGDQNIQTFLPQCDGGCEACGSATDDQCITADHSALTSYHSSNNISEQNPGPIAASMLRDPGLGRR